MTDFNPDGAAIKVYEMILSMAGVKPDDVAAIVSTGVGREGVKLAQANITESGSAVRGIRFVNQAINTVIDLGAEGNRRSLKPDGKGR